MRKILLAIGILILVVLFGIGFSLWPNVLRTWNSLVMDNRQHDVSCENLPNIDEVEKTVLAHKDTVDELISEVAKRYGDEEIVPFWDKARNSVRDRDQGFVVELNWGQNTKECKDPTKGDILVIYMSHRDREIIEEILGPTFFGIPYQGMNV